MKLESAAAATLLAAASATLIAFGLQAVGLVHVSLLLVWVALVGVLLAACLVTSPRDRTRWWGPPALLLALAGWTFMQLVPLPPGLLARVSPAAFELRSWGRGQDAWMPATLDVIATTVELTRLLGYCGMALVLSVLTRNERSRRVLVWGLAGACLLFAVVTVLHTVSRTAPIWGVYAPRDLRTGLLKSTLVNANHVAGILAASAPLLFALAIREGGRRRWLLMGTGAVHVMLSFLTLSRGGALACLLGCSVFAIAVTRTGSRRTRHYYGSHVLVAAFSALGVALAVAFTELRQVVQTSVATGITTENKVRVWKDALGLIRDYWITGSGRGTFAQAFTRYREVGLPRDITFHYPENLLVQLAAEWGVPIAASVVVLGSVWLVRTWRASLGHRTRTAAIAGLTALLAQNLVDFSLEVPAVAVLAIALASLAAGTIPGRSARRPTESAPALSRIASRAMAWAVAVAAIAVPIFGGSAMIGHEYRADADRLARALRNEPSIREAHALIGSTTARHPADHALALLAGEWAARRRLPEAMAWLNRAQLLNPRGGSVHIAVARALARGGYRNQALLELRLAQLAEPLRGTAIAAMAEHVGSTQALLRAYVATGRGSGSRAMALSEALRRAGRAAEEVAICDGLARRQDPDYRHFGMVCHAEALLSLGEQAAAGRSVRILLAEEPRPALGARALAVLSRVGTPAEVRDALLHAVRRHPHDTGLLRAAADEAMKRGDWSALLEWGRRIATTAGTNTGLLAEAATLEGQAYLGMSRPHSALLACERGLAESPEHAPLLRCLADAAYAAGDRRRARSAYRDLAAMGNSDPVVQSRSRE